MHSVSRKATLSVSVGMVASHRQAASEVKCSYVIIIAMVDDG